MSVLKKWGRLWHFASVLLALAILPLIICGCASSGDRDPNSMSSIVIDPSSAKIAKGLSTKMTALGVYRDGVSIDLTTLATWSSSDTSIATVKDGLVTGIATGTVDIVASYGNVSSQATKVIVTDSTIEQVEVIDENEQIMTKLELFNGTQKQLQVRASMSDGTTVDITNILNWSSNDDNIATVDTTGMVYGQTPGETKIIGTIETDAKVSTSAEETEKILVELPVTVVEAQIVELTIDPNDLELALGCSDALSATAKYENGCSEDVTMSATWSSSDNYIALVELNGLSQKAKVTSISEGTSEITAEFEGKIATCQVKVNPAELVSLSFNQTSPSIIVGQTTDLTVSGGFTDDSYHDVTDNVEFSTSNPNVAVMEPSGPASTPGRVYALEAGTATITATSENGIKATVDVNVSNPKVTYMTITPASYQLKIGGRINLTTKAAYNNGIITDVTDIANWTSSNDTVATVNKGVVNALNGGTVTITASLEDQQVTATINIDYATVTSLSITPDTANLSIGESRKLTATANYSDGMSSDASYTGTWTSSDDTIATISNGTVHALKSGDVVITVKFQGYESKAYIRVN